MLCQLQHPSTPCAPQASLCRKYGLGLSAALAADAAAEELEAAGSHPGLVSSRGHEAPQLQPADTTAEQTHVMLCLLIPPQAPTQPVAQPQAAPASPQADLHGNQPQSASQHDAPSHQGLPFPTQDEDVHGQEAAAAAQGSGTDSAGQVDGASEQGGAAVEPIHRATQAEEPRPGPDNGQGSGTEQGTRQGAAAGFPLQGNGHAPTKQAEADEDAQPDLCGGVQPEMIIADGLGSGQNSGDPQTLEEVAWIMAEPGKGGTELAGAG